MHVVSWQAPRHCVYLSHSLPATTQVLFCAEQLLSMQASHVTGTAASVVVDASSGPASGDSHELAGVPHVAWHWPQPPASSQNASVRYVFCAASLPALKHATTQALSQLAFVAHV